MRHDSARHRSLTHSLGDGGGQEAVPVPTDGMRAPPATEADPDVDETDVVEETVVDTGIVVEVTPDPANPATDADRAPP